MLNAHANASQPAKSRLLTLVFVLLSIHFSIAYNTLTFAMVPFTPDQTLAGKGGPFAFRMMPSLLWELFKRILGPLHARVPRLHFPILNKPFTSNEDWFMVLLTFFSLLATLQVARHLVRLIDPRPGFEWIALGLGYAVYFDTILVLNRNLFYSYDVLGLFFFTLLILLAFRGRPLWFTVVLLIAMLNKETAIVAVLLYFGLQYRRAYLARHVALTAGMGLSAIAVRLMQRAEIHHTCAACSTSIEIHLRENLQQFVNPIFWVSAAAVFGFAWVPAILFWRYVPRHVRFTTAGVALFWSVAMLCTGIIREIRIFSELSALLLLVVSLGIHGFLEKRELTFASQKLT